MLINCVSSLTDLAVLGALMASGFNKVISQSARRAVFYPSPPLTFLDSEVQPLHT